MGMRSFHQVVFMAGTRRTITGQTATVFRGVISSALAEPLSSCKSLLMFGHITNDRGKQNNPRLYFLTPILVRSS